MHFIHLYVSIKFTNFIQTIQTIPPSIHHSFINEQYVNIILNITSFLRFICLLSRSSLTGPHRELLLIMSSVLISLLIVIIWLLVTIEAELSYTGASQKPNVIHVYRDLKKNVHNFSSYSPTIFFPSPFSYNYPSCSFSHLTPLLHY